MKCNDIFIAVAILLLSSNPLIAQIIEPIGCYELPRGVRGLCVKGNYVYVADGFSGLFTIDVSDPAAPEAVDTVNTQYAIKRVDIEGDYAYVLEVEDHPPPLYGALRIFDISSPGQPDEIGNLTLESCHYSSIFAKGDYVYIAGDYWYLHVIDVSNPANPVLYHNIYIPGSKTGLFATNDYLFIANPERGFYIVNISDTINYPIVSIYDTPAWPAGVYINGSYAYISDFTSLQIVDISDPTNPTFAGSYDEYGTGYFERPIIKDTFAYLVEYNGLLILNISIPESPTYVCSYQLENTERLDVSENLIFIGTSNWFSPNLMIFRFTMVGVDNEPSPLPEEFMLSQNHPNPFNTSTEIKYTLPFAEYITLEIYDILGRKTATLFNEYQTAGYKSLIWNGRNTMGDVVSSGIYFYRLTTGEISFTKRMMLIK